MKNLSYWESETYFRDVDFVVVGSGIVGLSTAHFLRKNHPQAKILILERGVLPEGASTKNAGFACFGTVSELLNYSKDHSRAAIFELVRRRYDGLQTLRALLGDEAIQYREWGGHEIYRPEDAASWGWDRVEYRLFSAFRQMCFVECV